MPSRLSIAPNAQAAERVLEFFTAHIRNPNTRKAYARAVASSVLLHETEGASGAYALMGAAASPAQASQHGERARVAAERGKYCDIETGLE